MDALVQKLLDLLAAFGLGILLVLGAGFYLHYQLKRDAARRDAKRDQPKDGPEAKP